MTNNLKTAVFLAALGGIIVALGAYFGYAGFAFVVALAMVGGSYFFSAKLAIKSAGAKPLGDNELLWLREMVAELATAAKMPMPKLYIAPSMQPNAFATGRNPKHAAVAVTAGILEVLDREELRAVLAHEMSHVMNRDILLTSVAAVFGTTISMIANFLPFGMLSNRENSPNPIFAILTAILAPLGAVILQMALSRSREFQADASGAALLNHNGEELAQALLKIEAYAQQIPMKVDPSQASAYIINPLAGFKVSGLFSTHPPTAERVARLRALSQRN